LHKYLLFSLKRKSANKSQKIVCKHTASPDIRVTKVSSIDHAFTLNMHLRSTKKNWIKAQKNQNFFISHTSYRKEHNFFFF